MPAKQKKLIVEQGFAVVEVIIAMVILILTLSAVTMVSFGSQSLLIDSQTNAEAVSLAQELLENEQALARQDFNLVNPVPLTAEDIYQKKVDVVTQADHLTKLVTVTITWVGEPKRDLSTSLSTLVTNFDNAEGGDTADSVLTPSGDAWKNPQIKNSVNDFGQLVGDVSSSYTLTDADAYQGKLYVSAGQTTHKTDPTFFIFDITNPVSPFLISGGQLDNAIDTTAGLNALVTDGRYVYAASATSSNFSICSQSSGCAQLQVFDVQNPSSPHLEANYKIPGVTGSGGQAVGKSIFYKSGYIYLGLTKTGAGPEFNIIDVRNPSNPMLVGGYNVGDSVNSIFIKGRYAFVSKAGGHELLVLNISNPASPTLAGKFDTTSGDSQSVALVGDTLYLGTVSPAKFLVLNNSDPSDLQINNPCPAEQGISGGLKGLITRDYLTFVLSDSDLQVWKIDLKASPWQISQWAAAPLALPSSGGLVGPSFDGEGNYFFVVSNDSGNSGHLFVIAP